MPEEKTFLLVNAIPNMEEKESFQLYLSKIVPIFLSHGAENMQRFKTIEQVMGNGGIKASAVFEFPSAEAIKGMIASEEFNALNELRKKAYVQDVDLMICQSL
jgi:uncharacterized protein (DUF1330 family)